eukprot:TRINITY_DN6218_c0_g3_i1.p2 TRINITY_DN6218_c0_g3~~TRINITY_DN6218_c0_g3_i1.p2  ORF type:complete len:203 (+),score=32.18 TRINITY_DN6218_c0_g3_i1:75-683(+)
MLAMSISSHVVLKCLEEGFQAVVQEKDQELSPKQRQPLTSVKEDYADILEEFFNQTGGQSDMMQVQIGADTGLPVPVLDENLEDIEHKADQIWKELQQLQIKVPQTLGELLQKFLQTGRYLQDESDNQVETQKDIAAEELNQQEQQLLVDLEDRVKCISSKSTAVRVKLQQKWQQYKEVLEKVQLGDPMITPIPTKLQQVEE